MGLDMFLYKVKREEVAYWRKANAIHGWFERKYGGIENCADYPVTKEDLEELRSLCEHVFAETKIAPGKVKNGERYNDKTNKWEPIYEDGKVILNPEVAEELLPSQAGFFFGSTEYDQYYLEDLENTIEQIDNILQTTDFDREEVVYSAWW